MDLKKLAVGIIILGILVAGYGVIVSLSAGPKAPSEGSLTGQLDRLLAADDASETRRTNLPYIIVGAGIIVLGVVVRFAAKKESA